MNWDKIVIYVGLTIMILVALHAAISFVLHIGRLMFG